MNTQLNIHEINDQTGYADGEKFTNEKSVKQYFTVENMRDMQFENELSQSKLDEMAEFVIDNHSHMIITDESNKKWVKNIVENVASDEKKAEVEAQFK